VNDDDRSDLATIQNHPQLGNELGVVDSAEVGRILSKFGQGLGELGAAAILVAPAQVVHAYGSLNQALIEEPERPPGHAPQVFPLLVGVKIMSGVEKIYSLSQKVSHGKNLRKLLRDMVRKASSTLRGICEYTRRSKRHQSVSGTGSMTGSLLLQ